MLIIVGCIICIAYSLYFRYLLWLSKSAFHSCFETVSSASLSKHVQYRPKLLTFLPIHIFIEYGTHDVVRFISISKKNKQLQSYELNGSLMIFYYLNPITSNELSINIFSLFKYFILRTLIWNKWKWLKKIVTSLNNIANEPGFVPFNNWI